MTSSRDLDQLVDALSRAHSVKIHEPEDREAAAAKIARLRELRLAAEAAQVPQLKRRSTRNAV